MADLRRVVVGAPAAMRKTFEVLLRDGRMRVQPHAERGYRVEGAFVLSPKRLRRTPEDAAQQVLIAGAGNGNGSLPMPIPLAISAALQPAA